MNILIFMIPLAIFLGLLFMVGFICAAASGQYDDLETPQLDILQEHLKTERNEP